MLTKHRNSGRMSFWIDETKPEISGRLHQLYRMLKTEINDAFKEKKTMPTVKRWLYIFGVALLHLAAVTFNLWRARWSLRNPGAKRQELQSQSQVTSPPTGQRPKTQLEASKKVLGDTRCPFMSCGASGHRLEDAKEIK